MRLERGGGNKRKGAEIVEGAWRLLQSESRHPYHYFRRNTLTIKLNCMKRKERTMATIDTVKEVLVENLDLEAEKITEEATLESLGIDSLDMVELICDLEEKCDVEFGEPEGIETVGQLVAHIDSL